MLVCTTIIESGLDIPNCNTIIIEGADRFGLSQLYQLRGRVGRFKHQAYAYLLLHRHTRLLDIARQRLNALRQHNQLGAGFRIAMRDLELRGAGNLLGAEQSGHIVGRRLRTLLPAAAPVRRAPEGRQERRPRSGPAVKLDFVFVGEGAPAGATAAAMRMATPRSRTPRLAAGRSVRQSRRASRSATSAKPGCVSIFTAGWPWPTTSPSSAQIEAELRDRFGKFGDEVRALLLVTEIRIRAEQKRVLSVETEGNRLKCLRNIGRRDDWVMAGKQVSEVDRPPSASTVA